MSQEISTPHEVRFSAELQGDSNLQKAFILNEFYAHAVRNGVTTEPELTANGSAFVRAALDVPAGGVLFKANLLPGEIGVLRTKGFEITG